MKNPRVEPQNAFSASLKIPPLIYDSAQILCKLADQVGSPIVLELADDDPQIGTYAIVVAVADDPAKVAQLIALRNSWEE